MRPPGSVIFAASAPLKTKWQAMGPVIAFTAVALIFVALRWYSRGFLTRKMGPEDYIITAALFLSISMATLLSIALFVDHKSIKWKTDADALHNVTFILYSYNIVYQTSINLVKSSVIVQYLRIFTSRSSSRKCCIILAFLLITTCWGVLGGIFICIPIPEPHYHNFAGHCINPRAYWYSAAGLNILTDFAVWLFPMALIKQLHLPRKQKVGLAIVLSLGGLVCVFSVLRMLLVRLSFIRGDLITSGKAAILWSALELNVAIICACMMTLKPVLGHFFPRFTEIKSPAPQNMILPTMDTSFWGTTVTTTAGRSSTVLETPEPPFIKVDTETILSEDRVERSDTRITDASSSCGLVDEYSMTSTSHSMSSDGTLYFPKKTER